MQIADLFLYRRWYDIFLLLNAIVISRRRRYRVRERRNAMTIFKGDILFPGRVATQATGRDLSSRESTTQLQGEFEFQSAEKHDRSIE